MQCGHPSLLLLPPCLTRRGELGSAVMVNQNKRFPAFPVSFFCCGILSQSQSVAKTQGFTCIHRDQDTQCSTMRISPLLQPLTEPCDKERMRRKKKIKQSHGPGRWAAGEDFTGLWGLEGSFRKPRCTVAELYHHFPHAM